MRVVLDTNVVVSAGLFTSGRLAWLRAAWKSGATSPLIDSAGADELISVLAYPRFQLSESDIGELLGDYLPWTDVVVVEAGPAPDLTADDNLPTCRDQADQKFLALASISAADALVTGDRALLEMVDLVSFEILTPAELRKRLA